METTLDGRRDGDGERTTRVPTTETPTGPRYRPPPERTKQVSNGTRPLFPTLLPTTIIPTVLEPGVTTKKQKITNFEFGNVYVPCSFKIHTADPPPVLT